MVGLGGSASALPMGFVIAGADVCSVLCYLLLVRGSIQRTKAAEVSNMHNKGM